MNITTQLPRVKFRKYSPLKAEWGGNVRFLTSGDDWVINLREPKKRRKIMNIFKRKIKRDWYGSDVTEQEYIDKSFVNFQKLIDDLYEEIDLLKTLSKVEYIIIPQKNAVLINDKWLYQKEARKWAKENKYQFEKTVKTGELWIKGERE